MFYILIPGRGSVMQRRNLDLLLTMVSVFILVACASVNPGTHPTISPVVEVTSRADVETPIKPSPPPIMTAESALPQRSLPQGLSCGEIAYLSNRTGIAEIWLLNLATGLEKQLTETVCDDVFVSGYFPEWEWFGVQEFTWSPAGQHIAYLTKCKGAAWAHLWVHDLTTGSTTLITDQADDNSYPSWSPSSNELVFTVVSGRPSVYITDIGNRSEPVVKLITNTLGVFPVWSPGGSYIAYRGPALGGPGAAGTRTYLSIVDSQWRHLAYDPPASENPHTEMRLEWLATPVDGGLVWSHRGQYLAVATVREAVPGWISLITIEDQIARWCSGSLVSLDSNPFGRDFYDPVFSPDDETLYFVSVPPGSEFGWRFGTIFSVSVQDMLHGHSSFDIPVAPVSPEEQLAGFPALSSDGKWLVYVIKADSGSDLWIQIINDTHRHLLINDGSLNTRPAWRP